MLIFKSAHDVIKAKKLLDSAQIDYETMPTPKEISAECGMSLKVAEPSLGMIRTMLQTAEVRYRDDLL